VENNNFKPAIYQSIQNIKNGEILKLENISVDELSLRSGFGIVNSLKILKK